MKIKEGTILVNMPLGDAYKALSIYTILVLKLCYEDNSIAGLCQDINLRHLRFNK